jgi:hypothetical protein
VVVLGFSAGNSVVALNAFPNRLATQGGTLIYSDDPETALSSGVLYRDDVAAGLSRVYLYHVNGTGTAKKFGLVIENIGTGNANVAVTRRTLLPPSGNYAAIGKAASRDFYTNQQTLAPLSLPPGQPVLADSAVPAAIATTNQLVHSIHDITSDKPLRLSTVMVDSSTNLLTAFPTLPKSPDDGDNREGTFTGTLRTTTTPYVYDTASGIRRLRIADGGEFLTDPPLSGVDADTGAAALLRGNYGVDYDIHLNVTSSDGRQLAVLLNPRGGAYGGYALTTLGNAAPIGAMMSNDTSGQIPTTTHAGVCATVAPTVATQTLRVQLTPAGASSLAIDLLLVPFDVPTASWTVY